MPKANIVTCYREAAEPAALAAYATLSGPAVQANGGQFLAHGGRVESLEGGVAERTFVIEFDESDAALNRYKSDAYREALAALGDGVIRHMRVLEGAE